MDLEKWFGAETRQGICQQGSCGVRRLCAGLIYCMTEVWEGGTTVRQASISPMPDPGLNLGPKTDQILVPVLSISLASPLHRDSSHPSLSLTDHVSRAPLTSSPQLRLSLTAHLSLGEQNKPGPSQLSQISQLLQISQNFNHYKYKKHLNYQQYHNSITCHKKTHLLQLSHK